MSGMDSDYEEVFGRSDRNFGEGMNMPAGIAMVLSSISGMPAAGMFGTPITGDEVEYHDSPKITVPRGMTFERVQEIFTRLREEQEEIHNFDRRFRYRPDDGAYATAEVLRDRYGMALGKSIDMGFFGRMRPETRTIDLGNGEKVQVPWGMIEIPALPDVTITLCDRHHDREYGAIFELHVSAPKKHQKEVQAIFDAIEDQLRTGSIYRGKAIVGTDSPEFIDLSGLNPAEIVFSDDVTRILEGTVWAPLRYTAALENEGVRLKRTILLHGPYGTGKTSAGQITAQIAVENGWTAIIARPQDDIIDVLRTAKLYEPAVVVVEDVDTETSSGEDDEVKRLLDAFDGITAKGGKLVVVMTTNHLERIHKGMLRPGRFDAVLEIGSLDRGGVERLIKAIVPPEKLAKGLDFDTIHQAMDGFYPAFVREALERAKTFAIARLGGQSKYKLTTEDIADAALSLRAQLDALNAAHEGTQIPTLDAALRDAVKGGSQEAMHAVKVLEDGQDTGMELSVPSLNGNH